MKVLYITNYGSMYGANMSLLYMMKYLKKEFHIEPYLLASGGGEIIELSEKENIPCFSDDFRISVVDEHVTNKIIRIRSRKYMRIFDFYRIYTSFKRQNLSFDLIHTNTSITDLGLFLAKKWRIPHVWHVREFAREDYGLQSVFSRKELIQKYSDSDAIIAISQAIENKMQNYKLKNLHQIYNGVELPIKYQKYYLKDGVVNFCVVGVITEKKGQFDIVKACELLIGEGISNFKLYIVGDCGGNYYDKICNYTKKNRELENRVIFTGYRDDVDVFLKGMDVGIMASEFEAFGRVTIEYMANYMSVIGTNVGGTPELIAGIGKMYMPHDIMHLKEIMKCYIEHPEELKKNMEALRQRAEKFDVKDNASSICQIYEKLVR